MGVSTRYYYGINRVIYRVSNVYLSCIYRVCNVVGSGLVAKRDSSANHRRELNRWRVDSRTRSTSGTRLPE